MSPDLSPGQRLLEIYEVSALSGTGGMGQVHRVRHLGWDVDLAMKSPHPEIVARADGLSAFIREAEAWLNLGAAPHLVTCWYVRTILGVPRIFAEWMDGGSLSQAITRERGSASLVWVLDMAIQSAWGLAVAHARGLVHRDVKPANIMLTRAGVAKVTDFGLSTARPLATDQAAGESTHQRPWTDHGNSPLYASPEQARGGRITRATDVWSWAVSVLEMLTGEVTWMTGVAAPDALDAMLEDPSAPIRPPTEMVGLLRRCFIDDAEQREQSMDRIADELASIHATATGQVYPRVRPRDTPLAQADGLVNRGVSFIDLGRSNKAIECFRQALTVAPGHFEATYNDALLAFQEGRMSDQETLDAVTTAAQAEGWWESRLLLARIHLRRGDLPGALACIEEAVQRGAPIADVARTRALLPGPRRPLASLSLADKNDCAYSMTVAPDGSLAVVAGTDGSRYLLDPSSGSGRAVSSVDAEVHSWAREPPAREPIVLADGQLTVSRAASSQDGIWMWSLPANWRGGYGWSVNSKSTVLVRETGGDRVVTGHLHGQIRIWSPLESNWRVRPEVYAGGSFEKNPPPIERRMSGAVRAIALVTERMVASSTEELVLWDTLGVIDRWPDVRGAEVVALSKDGRTLGVVHASATGTIAALHGVVAPPMPPYALVRVRGSDTNHDAEVARLGSLLGGARAALEARDIAGAIEQLERAKRLASGYTREVLQVEERVAQASRRRVLRGVRDRKTLDLSAPASWLTLSGNGARLTVATSEVSCVFDALTGELVESPPGERAGAAVTMTPDGSFLASLRGAGMAVLGRVSQRTRRFEFRSYPVLHEEDAVLAGFYERNRADRDSYLHSGFKLRPSLSDDGQFVASGTENVVAVGDVGSGKYLHLWRNDRQPSAVILTADGARLIVTETRSRGRYVGDDGDGEILIIELGPEPVLRPLGMLGHWAHAAVTPDGSIGAFARAGLRADSGEVHVVELPRRAPSHPDETSEKEAEPQKPRALVVHHRAAIVALALSADARTLVTGGADNRVRIWHLDWIYEAAPHDHGFEEILPLAHAALSTCIPIQADGLTRSGAPLVDDGALRRCLASARLAGCGWLDERLVRERLIALGATMRSHGAQGWRYRPEIKQDNRRAIEATRAAELARYVSEARDHLHARRMRAALSSLRAARAIPGREFEGDVLRLWAIAARRFPRTRLRGVQRLEANGVEGADAAAFRFAGDDVRLLFLTSRGTSSVNPWIGTEFVPFEGTARSVAASADGSVTGWIEVEEPSKRGEQRYYLNVSDARAGLRPKRTRHCLLEPPIVLRGALAVSAHGNVIALPTQSGDVLVFRTGDVEPFFRCRMPPLTKEEDLERRAAWELYVDDDGDWLVALQPDRPERVHSWNLSRPFDFLRRRAVASEKIESRMVQLYEERCDVHYGLEWLRRHVPRAPPSDVRATTADGAHGLRALNSHSIEVIDLRSGDVLQTFGSPGMEIRRPLALALSPDGQFAAVVDNQSSGAFFLDWEVDDGEP